MSTSSHRCGCRPFIVSSRIAPPIHESPVGPSLRKIDCTNAWPTAKRIRFRAKEHYARRLPKGRKAKSPGELVQIDTLFVNIRPDTPVKPFTAYGPIAIWTIGRVSTEASATSTKALLAKLLREAPFPICGIQVDGGAESKSVFEAECQARGLELFVLPPNALTSTAASNAPNRLGDMNSTPPATCRIESTNYRPSSAPSPTDSTIFGRATPLSDKLRQSISKLSAKAIPRRLICAEPGHKLASARGAIYMSARPSPPPRNSSAHRLAV